MGCMHTEATPGHIELREPGDVVLRHSKGISSTIQDVTGKCDWHCMLKVAVRLAGCGVIMMMPLIA